MRAMIAVLMFALACGGSKDSETGAETGTGAAGSSSSSSSSTDAPTTGEAQSPEHPSGDSCPLLGLYVECDGGGRTYCDEFAGELRFGPCLAELACELSGPAYCERHCELVDGVPTWIEDGENCGMTSSASDSA